MSKLNDMPPREALDRLAVRILCGPEECQKDKDCPFDPMCAADLTTKWQVRLIVERVEELETALGAP